MKKHMSELILVIVITICSGYVKHKSITNFCNLKNNTCSSKQNEISIDIDNSISYHDDIRLW